MKQINAARPATVPLITLSHVKQCAVQAAKLQLGGKLQQRLSKAQQQDLLTNHALLLQASGQKDTSAAMVAALQSR